MPVHDWTRVKAGIFHHFHHDWITEIARVLNRGLLPPENYALAPQQAAGFGPDVLTLEQTGDQDSLDSPDRGKAGSVSLASPKLKPIAETDMGFYRRKQSTIAIRHISGDTIVAMIEVVSPGNNAGAKALRAFVEKAAELLDHRIHLLIIDLHPRGRRDPQGIHSAIWGEITGEDYLAPRDQPLTLAAYESGLTVRAFVVHVAVGDALAKMPLFLAPEKSIDVPLEVTYQAAFADVPRKWQRVLETK